MSLPRAHTQRPRVPALGARLAAALSVVVSALLLVAPGVAHADDQTPGAPPGQAWVRIGHFVPGMGATTIELLPLDGSAGPIRLARRATYGDVSTYQRLAPGSYTVTVRLSTAAGSSAPMLSRSLEIAANDARTIAVLGTAAAPRLGLLTDDLATPPAGTARVRLLSASQTADAVTVRAVGGPTIARGVVLGQATAYATVPAGSWTLALHSDTAATQLQAVPIASGSVYTVVVLDASPLTVRLEVVTDAAGATTAPHGGARTGLGGMAPGRVSAPAPDGTGGPTWAIAVALLGAALGLRAGLLRTRRGIVGQHRWAGR